MMMWLTAPRKTLLLSQLLLFHLYKPSSQFSATLDNKSPPPSCNTIIDTTTRHHTPNNNQPPQQQQQLSGSWSTAKQALQSPNCCVVSISGLDHHLSTLQTYFCNDDAPSDIDLRMRIRCIDNHDGTDANNSHSGDDANATTVVYEDCARVYTTIMDPPRLTSSLRNNSNNSNVDNNPGIQALQELALGLHSLANDNDDRPLQQSTNITDVHMRIVCASNYKAIDPPFHTDKCPLRGYVTLTGPGTEYMDVTCEPWEYVALRTLGVDGLSMVNRDKVVVDGGGGGGGVKMAKELEFIVMKGDYYDDILPNDEVAFDSRSSIKKKLWSRSEACVHRSPPGNNAKRVILSLDLADGGDDQEWEERGRKRNWRVGMTQRKSHLVS